MIKYSLFEKLVRNEMSNDPCNDQGDLDAVLLIEDKRENLIINNLAREKVLDESFIIYNWECHHFGADFSV